MASTNQPGPTDPVVTWLRDNGFPLTRESYRALAAENDKEEIEYPEEIED